MAIPFRKRLAFLKWLTGKRNIEEGHVGVLKLQALLSVGEGTVANCQELLFIKEKIPFIVDSPFIFPSHRERINWRGLDTHPAKEVTGHVHRIFLGISLDGFVRHFRADNPNHSTRASGFAKIAADTFFRTVVVSQ